MSALGLVGAIGGLTGATPGGTQTAQSRASGTSINVFGVNEAAINNWLTQNWTGNPTAGGFLPVIYNPDPNLNPQAFYDAGRAPYNLGASEGSAVNPPVDPAKRFTTGLILLMIGGAMLYLLWR